MIKYRLCNLDALGSPVGQYQLSPRNASSGNQQVPITSATAASAAAPVPSDGINRPIYSNKSPNAPKETQGGGTAPRPQQVAQHNVVPPPLNNQMSAGNAQVASANIQSAASTHGPQNSRYSQQQQQQPQSDASYPFSSSTGAPSSGVVAGGQSRGAMSSGGVFPPHSSSGLSSSNAAAAGRHAMQSSAMGQHPSELHVASFKWHVKTNE